MRNQPGPTVDHGTSVAALNVCTEGSSLGDGVADGLGVANVAGVELDDAVPRAAAGARD